MTTEGQKLDALTLDEARGILHQLGYFSDVLLFLGLRLTPVQMQLLQNVLVLTNGNPEDALMDYCRDVMVADDEHTLTGSN